MSPAARLRSWLVSCVPLHARDVLGWTARARISPRHDVALVYGFLHYVIGTAWAIFRVFSRARLSHI
jgi:hypothetical protein